MAEKKLTILGIGAHMDDCWLGFGGTALKAVGRGHTVTFATFVTEYRKLWYVAGRGDEIKAFHQKQTETTGIRHIGYKHDYMRLQNTPELVDQVSQLLAEVKPDILFWHDPNETNEDHVALGKACLVASQHAECFVAANGTMKLPSETYQYTTGWQSNGFCPDILVDVSETINQTLRISSSYDELYANGRWPTKQMVVSDPALNNEPVELTAHSRFKFGQAITTGRGGGYAEGFRSFNPRMLANRLLAGI
jgi:N-acetylglucosamine malate deacetylase 1